MKEYSRRSLKYIHCSVTWRLGAHFYFISQAKYYLHIAPPQLVHQLSQTVDYLEIMFLHLLCIECCHK